MDFKLVLKINGKKIEQKGNKNLKKILQEGDKIIKQQIKV